MPWCERPATEMFKLLLVLQAGVVHSQTAGPGIQLEFRKHRQCGLLHGGEILTMDAIVDRQIIKFELSKNPVVEFRQKIVHKNYHSWVVLCNVYIRDDKTDFGEHFYGCIPLAFKTQNFTARLRMTARLALSRSNIAAVLRYDNKLDHFSNYSNELTFPQVYDHVQATFMDDGVEYILEQASWFVNSRYSYKAKQHQQCKVPAVQRQVGVFDPSTGIGRDQVDLRRRTFKLCVKNLLKPFTVSIVDPADGRNSLSADNSTCLTVESAPSVQTGRYYLNLSYVEGAACQRRASFCHVMRQVKAAATATGATWASQVMVTLALGLPAWGMLP